MASRSPAFDKGFRDELERLGVIPPLVTPAPPPPRPMPMPKQRPIPAPGGVRPVPPLVARSTVKGIASPPRSLPAPGPIGQQSVPDEPPVTPRNSVLSSVRRPAIDQSRPGSPPPPTPTPEATPQAAPAPAATPTPQPAPEPTPTPQPIDTPVAAPAVPFEQPMTPHTRAAAQMGVPVPEGSTEAAPTREGYRQVRTPDGSVWVVDYQGRLARPGSVTQPMRLGDTGGQQSAEATPTTPDERVAAAVTDINAAQGIQLRPRAAYGSDAEYDNAQRAAQAQIDRAQATIDTQGAQTTEVQQIATDNAAAAESSQQTEAYRTAPITSGPYQGQTLTDLSAEIDRAHVADQRYQEDRAANPSAAPGLSIPAALGWGDGVPDGYSAAQWAALTADAPPLPEGLAGSMTPQQWAYLVFTGRANELTGIRLDDGPNTFGVGNVIAWTDVPRQYNVGYMGDDVYNQINGLERQPFTAGLGAILPGTNPFNTWALDPSNQAAVNYVYDRGYTGSDGTTYTGGRAVWEYYASEQNLLTRSVQDILLDPLNALEVLSGGGGVAVRGGTALADAGGAVGVAGRVLRGAGRAAELPSRVVNEVPDAVLGHGLRVGVGIVQESNLNNAATRAVGTGVRRGIGWLASPGARTAAETGGQEGAQAGARAYDATGRVAPPPGIPGPVAPEASAAAPIQPGGAPPPDVGVLPDPDGTGTTAGRIPGNRVRFVTPTTAPGEVPTTPETGIVADVATTSRPRHIVFRHADGTETVVPVSQRTTPNADVTDRPRHVVTRRADGTDVPVPAGQQLTPNADTTDRPRHIVVRTSDGRETEFPLPEPDVTDRPIHVVIQHADGTETVIPPEMALAPNADVTTRPGRIVTRPADGSEAPTPPTQGPLANVDTTSRPRPILPTPTTPAPAPAPAPSNALPVSVTGTPLPETPIARVGATQDEAIAQSSPRTATPDDTPYEQPATVVTQRVPARDSRISATDYPALPTSTASQYDNIVLSNPDYSASGRYRQSLYIQDEATGDFRHRYDSRQGERIPEDFSPVIRDRPLPAYPTRAEVTQAENFVTLVDRYVARHGGPENQPTARAAASLRRDISTADGLNRQLESLDNGRPSPRQRAAQGATQDVDAGPVLGTASPTNRIVPTDSIQTDEARFQPRLNEFSQSRGLDRRRVQRLVAEGWNPDKYEPIRVWTDPGTGSTYVIDGHHRLAAARELGVRDIEVRPYVGDEAGAREIAHGTASNRAALKVGTDAQAFRQTYDTARAAGQDHDAALAAVSRRFNAEGNVDRMVSIGHLHPTMLHAVNEKALSETAAAELGKFIRNGEGTADDVLSIYLRRVNQTATVKGRTVAKEFTKEYADQQLRLLRDIRRRQQNDAGSLFSLLGISAGDVGTPTSNPLLDLLDEYSDKLVAARAQATALRRAGRVAAERGNTGLAEAVEQETAKIAGLVREFNAKVSDLSRQIERGRVSAFEGRGTGPRAITSVPNPGVPSVPATATETTTDQLRSALARFRDIDGRTYADAGAASRARAEELATITRLVARLAGEVTRDGLDVVAARLATMGDDAVDLVTTIRDHVARHGGPEAQPSPAAADAFRRTIALTDRLATTLENQGVDLSRPVRTTPDALSATLTNATPNPSLAPLNAPQAGTQAVPGPLTSRAIRTNDRATADPSGIGGRTLARLDEMGASSRLAEPGEPVRRSGGELAPLPSGVDRRAFAIQSRARQQDGHRAAVADRRAEQATWRAADRSIRGAYPPDLPAFRYVPEEYPIATAPSPVIEDVAGGYADYAVVADEDRALLSRPFVRTGNPAYGQTVGTAYRQARREIDELQRLGALQVTRPGTLSTADLKRVKHLTERFGHVGADPANVQTAEGAAERYLVGLFVQEAGLPVTARSRTWVGRAWKGLIAWTSRNLVSNVLDVPRRIIGDMVGDSFQLAITGNFAAIPNQFRYIRESYAATVNGSSLMETPYAQRLRRRGIVGRDSGYGTTFVGNDRSTFGALEDIARPRRRGLNRRGRDTINALDSARRLATAEGVWRREAGGLDKATLGSVLREADRSGLRLTNEEWTAELRRSVGWGVEDYGPTDLYAAVRTRALEEGLAPGRAHALADRVGRDYASRALDVHRQSVAEVNRSLFSYRYTNADELASNVLAFHFYQTRSARLYVQQAIKHPALASNYYRTMQGLEAYGDEHGFPPSLMGFMRLLNGPVGFTMFFSPTVMWDTFNAAKTMADQSGDATWFERMMEFPLMPGLNVPLSTVVNLAGYLPNGLAPDPTGLTSERQFGLAILNVVNSYFNPDGQVIGDPVADVSSWVRSHTSGVLPGTERVNSQDSTDYADSQVRALVIDAAEAEYGVPWEQFTDEQRAAVTAAQWDPSSPWYQTAYDQWTTGNAVLETGQLFTPLQPRGRITTDTEVRQAAHPRGDMAPDDPYDDQVGDLLATENVIAKRRGVARLAGDGVGETQPLTPAESTLYQNQQAAYGQRAGIDAGSERAATLGVQQGEYRDSTAGSGPTGQGAGAVSIYNYIAYADETSPMAGPLVIGGQTYRPERVAAMTPDERRALAQGMIDELGLTDELTAARDAQHTYVDAHPEFAAFHDWAGRARDYSGPGGNGPQGYWSDLTAQNPNAAAWYDAQSARYGGDDLIPDQTLTGTDGYLASRGIQIGRFDGNPLPTSGGEDVIVADPATDPAFNANAPATDTGTGGAGSGGSSSRATPDTPADVVSNVLKAQAEYEADLATFDEFSQQAYGADFVDLNPYAQNAVTAMMRQAGIATPSPSGLLRDFQEWQSADRAAGGDGSIDRYAAQKVQEKARQDAANATAYAGAGLTSQGDALPAAD